MKLSEAMENGAKSLGQAFGISRSSDGKHACALNAALYGVTGNVSADITMMLRDASKLWPGVDSGTVFCPSPSCHARGNLSVIIICLNDNHHWSFQQIATWLKSREDNYEAFLRDQKRDTSNPFAVLGDVLGNGRRRKSHRKLCRGRGVSRDVVNTGTAKS